MGMESRWRELKKTHTTIYSPPLLPNSSKNDHLTSIPSKQRPSNIMTNKRTFRGATEVHGWWKQEKISQQELEGTGVQGLWHPSTVHPTHPPDETTQTMQSHLHSLLVRLQNTLQENWKLIHKDQFNCKPRLKSKSPSAHWHAKS